MTFEESIIKLEEIVKKLDGDATLEEAIELFQQGIELSKNCMEKLKEQKGKIELLVDEIKNLTEEFNLSDGKK
ncbi:MAG: exodeoxyribonuclease VII small subunit [Clostridiales bacterium]|nr:exodeoxyribonuclease VII small subunit [Clostridiales bacterium]